MTERYDLQISACDDNEARIAKAKLIRGSIISDFAHVEYQLTDLFVRCFAQPAYSEVLAGKPPHSLDDYITMAGKIFNATEVLRQFSAAANSIFEKLRRYKN